MRLIKLFITALAATASISCSSHPDATADVIGLSDPVVQTDSDKEIMNVDAQTWASEIKMGWNLGNTLETQTGWNDDKMVWNRLNTPADEGAWGNPKVTREMLQAVKDAGFDAVRLPVNWGSHIVDEANAAIDPAWMARVQQVVDWCMELGLKVMLNTHHEYWLEWHPTYAFQKANNDKLYRIWTQIANRFKNYGPNLAFSGINEIHANNKWEVPTPENTAVTNSYNQTFIDAVRATGGKNLWRNLIVGCYSANPDYGLSGFTIPTDKTKNRLSVEFHWYRPWDYAGENFKYWYWGDKYAKYGDTGNNNEDYVRTMFARIKQTWYDKGLGVIMGEWGAARHYQPENKQRQLESLQYHFAFISAEARKNHFAAFVWDNSNCGNGNDQFGIFNRREGMKVANPQALNGIQEGSGQPVKDYTQAVSGTTIWKGNELLNWGSGLQLSIPASKFAKFTPASKMIISVDQVSSAEYDQIQLHDASWQMTLPYMVDGELTQEGKYSVRESKNTTSGSYDLVFTFDPLTLSVIKKKGIVMQGFGLYVTRVVLD